LSRKLAQLGDLESELAQRELELATIQAELHSFESRYFRIVGVLLAELDDINAQIAEAESRINPDDEKAKEKATEARDQANDSAEAAGGAEKEEKLFRPSDSLKKLYRDLAKLIHPDLAVDEDVRLRCQKLMAEANRAYEACDEEKLRAILAEWESSPDSVKGEGTAAELVRVIRKIAQVEIRLRAIETEMSQTEGTELYQLKNEVEKVEGEGRDMLNEMASKLDLDIKKARRRLAGILRREPA
jgi:hypothetical protein